MPKYIDADAAIEFVKKLAKPGDADFPTWILSMIEVLEIRPAANVRENKIGSWKYKSLDKFRKYSVTCPFCEREYIDNYDGYVQTDDFNFCPNCGAQLDGEIDYGEDEQ